MTNLPSLLSSIMEEGGSKDNDSWIDRPGNPLPGTSLYTLQCEVWMACLGTRLRVATSLYVTSQIAIAVPLGLSAFLTFVILRTKWSQFYMALGRSRGMFPKLPERKSVDVGIGSKLPTLSRDLFSWIPQVWKITDDQVLEAAGLDAYVVCYTLFD